MTAADRGADVVEIVAVLLLVGWVGVLLRGITSRRFALRPSALTGIGVATALLLPSALMSDAVVDAGSGPTAPDLAISTFARAHRSPLPTVIAERLDLMAGTTALGALAVLVAVLLGRRGHRFEAGLVLAAAATAAVASYGLKFLYGRPRPPAIDRLITEGGFSLPSGHALGSMAVLGVLAVVGWSLLRSRSARITLAAVAALGTAATGCSRVYLGVHWASDVLDGWLLGGVVIALCAAVLSTRRSERPAPAVAHAPPL
ncbi:MAG: hypothetical protein QOG20_386 [Pseudonocardiales bacterium]|nr:hypothetical protein [Pseudonocardiales bacterium]